MKRPKQQSQAFSFLSFFTRKPKSDPKTEKPTAALGRDEVAITLTPNEHEPAQQVRTFYYRQQKLFLVYVYVLALFLTVLDQPV